MSAASALKRLVADYKQLQESPLETVSAAPLEDDMFNWHVNLMAPVKSAYKGGIFHGLLKFTANYPAQGPDLVMLTELAHPHVYSGRVCLSILNNGFTNHFDNKEEGWNPIYTVSTILIQLQTFLLDEQSGDDYDKHWYSSNKDRVDYCVRRSELFSCQLCGHKPKKPYPPLLAFSSDKEKKKMEKYRKTEYDLIQSELVCFYSRSTYEDSVLGLPLNVEKKGKQWNITSTLDILSYDSYKAGIRETPNNATFNHWLPLYINKEHGEKALPLAKEAIALIAGKPSKEHFEPEMVLKVLPSLMNSMVVNLMNESVHTSMKAIEGYCAFHRLFIMFVLEYPELRAMVNEQVDTFVEKERNRRKDHVTSLGEWITLLSVSNKTWRDREVVRGYLSENFDRNAFWIVKAHPFLANELPNARDDESRAERTFETTVVSCRLLMFHVYFLNRVARPEGYSLEQIGEHYDVLLGRPSLEAREALQKVCVDILKAKSFDDFFRGIEFPNPSKELLLETLRLAMYHSRRKGYHKSANKYHREKIVKKTEAAPTAKDVKGNDSSDTKSPDQIKAEKIQELKEKIAEHRSILQTLESELSQLENEEKIGEEEELEEASPDEKPEEISEEKSNGKEEETVSV